MAISTDLIGKLEIFKTLPNEYHSELAQRLELRHFPADTKIVQQGEAGETFFIILNGTVNVSRTSEDGRNIFLNVLGAGDYFGEASLFHEVKRTANIVTQNEVEVIAMSKTAFLKLFEIHPAAVGRILFYMMQKLFFRVDQMSHELQFRRLGGVDQDSIDKLFS